MFTESYTKIRLQSSFRTSEEEWVFPIRWLVITVQLNHLDSTIVGELVVISILL